MGNRSELEGEIARLSLSFFPSLSFFFSFSLFLLSARTMQGPGRGERRGATSPAGGRLAGSSGACFVPEK